tara:strand:- start:144 stop:383 length:240 start_codon:yes stop_codon:yes gene_type:complete
MLKADGFNDAIIGVGSRCGKDDILVYDNDKIISILMKKDGMTFEEALEYFHFNILGSWVGEGTPMFLRKIEDDDLINCE